MVKFLKRLFGWNDVPQRDHRGHELAPNEKSVSARLRIAKEAKDSNIRRAPIDMAQGD